jgi:glycosyltransferase involved in cell wall biosynthesis
MGVILDNKIVILHVTETLFARGGTPRKLLSLVKNADNERFQHIFMVFNNNPDNLSYEIRTAGGIVEEVRRFKNYDIRLLFDICRMVRKYQVDIINTHFARSDIYGMVAGLLGGVPVIKSVHGILWNDSKQVIYMDRLLARFRYLTVCNSGASLEAERQRSQAKKLKLIHNGVVPRAYSISREESKAYKEKLGITSDGVLVGHVGGFISSRHQDLIVEAISIIVKQGIDAYCVMAGDGPQKEFVEQRAKSLEIAGRIKFPGYIDDVGEFLSCVDIYVNMASVEGFGIAVVEAMLAGIPVILASAGAHPELIVDGESGILVPVGSAEGLADALTRLAQDPPLQHRLAQGGKMRAEEKFTISRFVRDFENLYESCVQETLSIAR